MDDQIRERSPETAPTWDPEGDIRLLDALLNGIHTLRPMSQYEKISWIRQYLPRTYSLLGLSRHWSILIDLPEEVR